MITKKTTIHHNCVNQYQKLLTAYSIPIMSEYLQKFELLQENSKSEVLGKTDKIIFFNTILMYMKKKD